MNTALKILLGIVLALTVLVAGCGVLLGSLVNDIEEDINKPAITEADFRSVKVGSQGNTRKRIEARFGQPQSQKDIEDRVIEGMHDPEPGLACLYYNKQQQIGPLYQFCFDAKTQRVKSKARF